MYLTKAALTQQEQNEKKPCKEPIIISNRGWLLMIKLHFLPIFTDNIFHFQCTLSENLLEVHRAMSQVVFAPDVGDLLGLHGLQLRTVCDTMTETTAERTTPLSCENTKIWYIRNGLKTLHACFCVF